MKKILLFTVLLVSLARVSAQDFHLSQYDMAPQYLNPALTGVFLGKDIDYRLGMNFRSQWASILPNSYASTNIGFEMKLKGKLDRFGVGTYVINENAISKSFNSLTAMIGCSYQVMKKNNKHSLSTGIQLGILNLSRDMNNLTFDTQYTGNVPGGFDIGVPNEESNLSNQSVIRFDGNYGILYKYINQNSKFRPFMGLSLYHFLQPKESFNSLNQEIPIRWNINVGSDIQLNSKFAITPQILVMMKAKAIDFNIGALATYSFSSKSKISYQGIFGLSIRSKDAFIIHAGINKGNQIIRLSYDLNTSSLNTFTKGKGGFELSLILTAKRGESFLKSFTSF